MIGRGSQFPSEKVSGCPRVNIPPSAVSNDLFGHAPLSPLPLGQGEGEGPQGLAHLHTDPHPPPSGATVSAQGAALPEGRGSLRPLPSMPKEVSWTCTRPAGPDPVRQVLPSSREDVVGCVACLCTWSGL